MEHSTQTHPATRERSIRGITRKLFSFPVFLGMLLVGGAYMGRLGNLSEAPSSHSSIFWLKGDTWWHLAAAAQILKTHMWPTHDIYSFTAFKTPWIDYEWLGDIVLDLFWKHGGLQALMIFITIFAGLIMILLYYYASMRSKNSKAGFVAAALLLLLASLQFTTRPQVLGYALLIITLICLEKFRQGHAKALWLLPFVFWVWVNTHGTFVLGFLILGIWWISGLREFHFGRVQSKQWTPKERRQLELVFLLCLIASILTPYGTQLAAYPLKMFSSQHQIMSTVQEWQPLDLSQFYGKLFLAFLILLWVGITTSDLTFRVDDFLLLTFATAETFLHARFMILFVPVYAPLAAELLAQWIPKYQRSKDHPVLNFVLMGLIVLGIVKSFPSTQRISLQLAYEVPSQAVAFLKKHPSVTRMFNNANWGSYLIFALGPSRKVFIDGRYGIYQYIGVLSDYLSITHIAPDTLFLLRKYRVRSCLIRRGSPLATLLASSPNWKQIYHDHLSVLLIWEPVHHSKGLGKYHLAKSET